MGELTRRARIARAAVVGIVCRRPTLLLLGVAGVALLGALLSSSWSAHGQGLDMASVEAGSFWIDQGDAHLRSATTTNSPLNPDRASNDVNSPPTSGQIRAVFSSIADAPTSGGLAPTQTLDPDVLVTPTYLSIAEGSSGTYWIYLRTAPSGNVTVVISAGAGVTAYPAEVRFTPTAWRNPQIITVTGLDDTDSNDGRATITHDVKTGSASEYLSLDVRDVQVVIQDDDDAGISASPARMRIAEGDSGTIDVNLEAPPTADVTITGTISDAQWATIEPATLTFTSTDWSTPKQFTVTSTDDQRQNFWPERPTSYVTFASSSSDANYNGLAGPRVRLDIADDEGTGGGLIVEPRRLYIPEGGTATFTIALRTKLTAHGSDTPQVEMRIDVSGDLTTDPARVTFTNSNWASGVTVTVRAGDDDDGANDEVTIQISGAGGSDGIYVGTKAELVTTVIDDDTGGIINPTSITVPEGGRGYYKAAIISEPSGSVTISISTAPDVTPGVTTSASRLSITPSNWETPQYVIVSAPDDSVTQNVGFQLSHTIGGSSVEYDLITLPDVMVTVADGGAGPTNFARADETDGPRLSWSPPPTPLTPGLRDEVYQYEIERSVDDGVAFAFLTCVDADATSYLDDSVESDEAYRYRVRAVYYATDRCAALRDIELTAGTLVQRSAHGVWSDGDTIWVAHEADSKVYAYDLASGAAQADDDITPNSNPNSAPPADYSDVDGGLWGDATRIWTVTANYRAINTPEEVAFIPYRKSDGVFLSGDLVITDGDMRPLGYPGGVDRAQLPDAVAFFSDGSTFWAAASGRDTLFAYDASDGRRNYSKDIVVPDSVCDHDQVVGLWHDASQSLLYLATQCSTKKLFALDLSGGLSNAHHIPVHDITLPSGHGTINGFWSDGDIVWVSANTGSAATRDSLLAYPLHNNRQYSGWSSPPGVESVEVAEASISQIEATATVTVSQANGGLVNLRYRETASSGDWETTSLPGEFGVLTVDFLLSGLTADREYTVEASFDSSFPTTRTKTASFTTLPPAIESVSAIETDQTTATIRAVISEPNGDSKKVHLRYRIKDAAAWQPTDPVDTTDEHADFSLSDLTSGTDYELEASLDDTFPTDETTTGKFATEPPSVDSVVASGETQTGAKITVNVTEPNGSLVYIQYRAGATDTWKPESAEVASGESSHEFTLMDLTSDTTYEVEASYDNTFPDTDATRSDSFTTLPPSVESISVGDEGQTTATVTVGVAAPNGSEVHLQYRTGTDAWRTAKKAVIAEGTEAVFALRGLTSDREYEVEASYDSSFPDTDVTLSTTFMTLPPSVYSVIVGDKTKTTANAKIKIAAPNGDSQTVRLRYSPTAIESWTTAEPVTSTDADATIALSSLTAATQYKVEATLASDFISGVRPTVFSTLGDDPIVEDVFVYEADINQEDATATIIVRNAGGNAHEVHLRYRTAGETPGAWSTADLKADTDPNNSDTATIELTPLTAGTQYDVQASLDSTFATGTRQTTFTTDGPVPEIVSVIATSDSSTEATVTVAIEHPDGSTVYVGYRTTGNTPGSWSAPVDFDADTSRHTLTLSGLSPSTEYEVTAAFSTPFPVTPIVSDTFSTLAFDPTLTEVSVTDITQSGSGGAVKATVTVTILDAESQVQTVFVRYREHGAAAWSDPPLELSGTETATRDITTFMVSTSYDLQASLSSDFASPVEATFSTPDVIEVTVKDVTDESAKAVVTIGEPGTAQKTVHLRYGPVSDDPVGTVTKAGSGGTTTKDTAGLGATETHTAMGRTPGDTAEIPVANLLPDQEYVLEASLDDGFTRGVERITFRTEPAGSDGTGGGGTGSGGSGGGGGGPAPKPVPSDADFTWNVTRDIDSLHGDHTDPTGIWGNDELLWVLQNSTSGPDAIFVYDLETGERVEDREFELDQRNRFSHGIWSDGETMWISDSGRDLLFAYDLDTGERLPELDIELHEDNRDPRDIWSDGEVIYVLDNRRESIFAYELETGELITEYELDDFNADPRGIWSDGVTLWVSDDGANRIFAYRINGEALDRIEEEEFDFQQLLRAGNGDPRGIWSDGGVVYIVDDGDDKVYTYNLPDAIDARLESLSLSGIEISRFSPRRRSYVAILGSSLTETTVEPVAIQEEATVTLAPADADDNADNGHQVAVSDGMEISVTVISPDGSRTRVYRVSLLHCLSGLTEVGLSVVTYVGGSLSDLAECARDLSVGMLYDYTENSWTGFFLDYPLFLNQPFRDRFVDGLPVGQALIARRATAGSENCLSGLTDEHLSLVTYAGGSLAELEDCARDLSVDTLYSQTDDGWTGFFPGYATFLSQPFRERFPDGPAPGQALIAKRAPAGSERCLPGLTEAPLSAVTYTGGSIAGLAECARSLSVDALYHYTRDGWTGFFPDHPDFLSQPFLDRFAGGLADRQSLVAKRNPAAITTPTGGSPN